MLRYLPNSLTLLRMLLAGPVCLAITSENPLLALLLFLLAGLTDGLDGYLARRFGWSSHLGAMLDPLADKLLLVSVYISLTLVGWLPLWLTALVLLRDVVILTGAVAYRLLSGPFTYSPTRAGKLTTVLQIALVLLVLLAKAWAPGLSIFWLISLTAVVTTVSGLQYVMVWGKRYLQESRGSSDRPRDNRESNTEKKDSHD